MIGTTHLSAHKFYGATDLGFWWFFSFIAPKLNLCASKWARLYNVYNVRNIVDVQAGPETYREYHTL